MHFLNQWVLTILLLVPLGGAVAVVLLRHRPAAVRRVALGATVAACAVSLLVLVPFRWRQMLSYDEGPRGSVRLSQKIPLVAGAEYHVAVDGLSIPFVILTSMLFSLLCAAAWNDPAHGAAYFATLLILEFATVGIFLCFDLLFFVALMVVAAAAGALLARLSGEDTLATRSATAFLSVSAACLFCALIVSRTTGSFDLIRLAQSAGQMRLLPTWALVLTGLGLLVRAAAFPVHTWLVGFLSQSRTSAAIVMTCVVPATGAYGVIRLVLPLSSGHAGAWSAIMILGIVGYLVAGLCAMAADRLGTFIVYATVSAMGCVLLAVGLRVPTALDGAVMLLLGHSLVSAIMLILAKNSPASPASDRAPMWNAFFAIAWIAWLVAPVLGGQVVVAMACFEWARSAASGAAGYAVAVAAVFGILVNAIAAARIARLTFMAAGQAPTEAKPVEPTGIDVTVLSILSGVAILLGLLPGVLCYTFTHPAARALLRAD